MDSDLFRDTFNVANCWSKKSGKHSIEIVLVLLSRSSMLVMAEGTAGSMTFMPSRFAFPLVSSRDLFGRNFLWPPQNDAREGLAKNQGSKIRLLLEI